MSATFNEKALAAALACALLAGCGGGSGGTSEPLSGTLSLAVTDAPVDDVSEVVVQFTGVRVKPRSGEAIEIDFGAPLNIDLLSLTGENSATLLNGEPLPAGEYDWIALEVNAELDTEFDSYVLANDGGMIELEVPSGSQ